AAFLRTYASRRRSRAEWHENSVQRERASDANPAGEVTGPVDVSDVRNQLDALRLGWQARHRTRRRLGGPSVIASNRSGASIRRCRVHQFVYGHALLAHGHRAGVRRATWNQDVARAAGGGGRRIRPCALRGHVSEPRSANSYRGGRGRTRRTRRQRDLWAAGPRNRRRAETDRREKFPDADVTRGPVADGLFRRGRIESDPIHSL